MSTSPLERRICLHQGPVDPLAPFDSRCVGYLLRSARRMCVPLRRSNTVRPAPSPRWIVTPFDGCARLPCCACFWMYSAHRRCVANHSNPSMHQRPVEFSARFDSRCVTTSCAWLAVCACHSAARTLSARPHRPDGSFYNLTMARFPLPLGRTWPAVCACHAAAQTHLTPAPQWRNFPGTDQMRAPSSFGRAGASTSAAATSTSRTATFTRTRPIMCVPQFARPHRPVESPAPFDSRCVTTRCAWLAVCASHSAARTLSARTHRPIEEVGC